MLELTVFCINTRPQVTSPPTMHHLRTTPHVANGAKLIQEWLHYWWT